MENINQPNLMCVWERSNARASSAVPYPIFVLKPESFHIEHEDWDFVFGPASEAECKKYVDEMKDSYTVEDYMEGLIRTQEEIMREEEEGYYDQTLDELDRDAFEP